MLHVLIADDEPVERDGIRFLLRKYQFPFEIEEAENGQNALDILTQQPVDILFTDVRMPFMDGLALSQAAIRVYPPLKIIIFSGYGEFEYAQKAIQLGVSNYILKPVKPDEFRKTVTKVMNLIDAEHASLRNREKVRNYEKEHLINCVISGVPIAQLQGRFDLDITFLENYHGIALLESNRDLFDRTDAHLVQLLQAQISYPFDYLNLNSLQSLLLFTAYPRQENAIRPALNRIHPFFLQNCGESVYCATSRYFDGGSHIPEIFSTLEKMMEDKFFLKNTYLFSPAETASDSSKSLPEETILAAIHHFIAVKDCTELRNSFLSLMDLYPSRKSYSYIYVKYSFTSILKSIYHALSGVSTDTANRSIESIYKSGTISNAAQPILEAIDQLKIQVKKEHAVQSREVETSKSYIYAHFSENLNLETLAEKVFLTPSYLSNIFKKETGVGINRFIKSCRMEKARELLKHTNLRIGDISIRVGYNNVSYFVQSFREFYGVSPEKFRNGKEPS